LYSTNPIFEKFPENFFSNYTQKNRIFQKILEKYSLAALSPLFRHRKRGYIRGDTGGGRGTPLLWGVSVGGFANLIPSRFIRVISGTPINTTLTK